ncbi:MAG: excinuclease ABC subunit UvrC [Candidatus Saccharibacteria bacterium]|nr:excinuclease ABC subunit UvrC [Candidatus Saccharibacteria bacterium]
MKSPLEEKLAQLPTTPGVYFHKNAAGEIIYIGKAANLRGRVRQYFQKSRGRDPKTEALVAEIRDIDWREVETELDALFLEAELIRRYMPQYNILLRDDKSLAYVRVSHKSKHPTVTITRRPLDDNADYLGPYHSALTVKRALKALRKIFPYSTHKGVVPKRACLQAHLGLCPGLEADMAPLGEYRANLKKLTKYLRAERVQVMRELEKEMKESAKKSQFEKAAKLRNQLFALRHLSRQIVFSDSESLDISKDYGLRDLQKLLNLPAVPRRIEGYDVSHQHGTDNVASMVVFTAGIPDKSAYRKFKLRIPGNNDFAHMHEALSRRLKPRYIKNWGKPDLILIDGGKGQLSSAIKACEEAGIEIPMIGLAKREEEIIMHVNSRVVLSDKELKNQSGFVRKEGEFLVGELPKTSHIVKLLQRIRDESHRFAVSYHSSLKQKRQTASILEEIPTIGPATRKKLTKAFGGFRGVVRARRADLEKVVGKSKASLIRQYLRAYKSKEDHEKE